MKKIILLIFLGGISFMAMAQEKGRHHRHHDMARELNLSDQQKEKMKQLQQEFRQEMHALDKKDDLTVKEWRERKEDLREKHQQQMKSVLSDEQISKIEKKKAERKALAESRQKHQAEQMKIKLGLTDQQVAQMKKGQDEFRHKMQGLKENKSMDKQAKREAFRKLAEERKASLDRILTPEQKEKIKEGKKGKRHHAPRRKMPVT